VTKFRALSRALTLLLLLGGCTPPISPIETPTGPWRFAVVGDTRGTGVFDPVNGPALSDIARGMVADGVDLVLVPGDLVYGTPLGMIFQLEAWRNLVAPLYKAGIRVYPVRGNHEFIGGDADWKKAFDDLPQNGPEGEIGLTYSFAHNNALFVGLDEYVHAHRVNQPYLDTLLTDPRHPTHTFVFGHEPAFSAGHTTTLAMELPGRDAFWNSLGAAGVTMYLCGHDHFYGRSSVPDAAGHSVQQLIVGAGGAPFSTFVAYVDPRAQPLFADSGHYGYLLVQIDGDAVDVQYKAQLAPAQPGTFTTIDQFTYTVPAPAQP
jgi:hypothetical protein